MFDPVKEVPNLELCKKLKELGFPQDNGIWYWKLRSFGIWDLVFYFCSDKQKIEKNLGVLVKAPTVCELGEWLPADIGLTKISLQDENG